MSSFRRSPALRNRASWLGHKGGFGACGWIWLVVALLVARGDERCEETARKARIGDVESCRWLSSMAGNRSVLFLCRSVFMYAIVYTRLFCFCFLVVVPSGWKTCKIATLCLALATDVSSKSIGK
jgi:hypothetical protein